MSLKEFHDKFFHCRYVNTAVQCAYYLRVLYSEWMQLAVGDCSLYAVTTWIGAESTCQHIDYSTSSLFPLKTQL